VKALLVLGVLVVVGVVVVKNTHFYAYSEVTDAQGRTAVHCYAGCDVVDSLTGGASSPEFDDAVAIAQAADSRAYSVAAHRLTALLLRANGMSRRRGAALVWKRAPSLIGTLSAEQSGVLARLTRLTMKTQAGELCRRAGLRAVSRYQWAMRDLGSRFTRAPTWPAVVRFAVAIRSTQRSLVDDVEPCLATAPSGAREAFARVMVGA